MRRLILFLLAGVLFLQSSSVVSAKGYSYKAPKSYSMPKVPRTPSNPKYIAPRKDIPVPKSESVKPYFKKDGTLIPGHQRAPKNSLKPWYNPFYQK